MSMLEETIQREVLLGPDVMARAAAIAVKGRAVRWMLGQPRAVRRSYVERVVDKPEHLSEEDAQQRWMLAQEDPVRHSYIRDVLLKRPVAPPPEHVWMLRNPEKARLSYIRDVMDAPPNANRPEVVWMLRQSDAVRESYVQEVVGTGI